MRDFIKKRSFISMEMANYQKLLNLDMGEILWYDFNIYEQTQ